MARVVNALRAYSGAHDYGRFSDYPWEEWTDGNYWEITHGEDYKVSSETMRIYLYGWRDRINKGEAPQPNTGVMPPKEQVKAGTIPQWQVRTKIVDADKGIIRFRFRPA